MRKRRKGSSVILRVLWIVTAIAAVVVLVIYYKKLDELDKDKNIVFASSEANPGAGETQPGTTDKPETADNEGVTDIQDKTGTAATGENGEVTDTADGQKAASEDPSGSRPSDYGSGVLVNDRTDTDEEKASEKDKPAAEDETGESGQPEPAEDELENSESLAGGDEGEENVIDPSKPMVALTFDDGPSGDNTDRILNCLEENNAKATFFMVGYNITEHKDQVKRVYELGCQIGNHSAGHLNLTKLTKSEFKKEIEGNNDLINSIVPVGDCMIRPPYGSYNDTVKSYVKVPMICWSVDTLDWKSRDKDEVIKEAKKSIKDGSIVLMHDLYSSTAAAAEYLIPYLIEQGYQLVTVSEMFEARGEELIAGEVYRYAQAAKTSGDITE